MATCVPVGKREERTAIASRPHIPRLISVRVDVVGRHDLRRIYILVRFSDISLDRTSGLGVIAYPRRNKGITPRLRHGVPVARLLRNAEGSPDQYSLNPNGL